MHRKGSEWDGRPGRAVSDILTSDQDVLDIWLSSHGPTLFCLLSLSRALTLARSCYHPTCARSAEGGSVQCGPALRGDPAGELLAFRAVVHPDAGRELPRCRVLQAARATSGRAH